LNQRFIFWFYTGFWTKSSRIVTAFDVSMVYWHSAFVVLTFIVHNRTQLLTDNFAHQLMQLLVKFREILAIETLYFVLTLEGSSEFQIGIGHTDDAEFMSAGQLNINIFMLITPWTLINWLPLVKLLGGIYFRSAHFVFRFCYSLIFTQSNSILLNLNIQTTCKSSYLFTWSL